ncbi:hypothetical protein ACF0H5_011402 [Mactra antiquata]
MEVTGEQSDLFILDLNIGYEMSPEISMVHIPREQYTSKSAQTYISMVDRNTLRDWYMDVPSTTINLPDMNIEDKHEIILDISNVRSDECDTTWTTDDSND